MAVSPSLLVDPAESVLATEPASKRYVGGARSPAPLTPLLAVGSRLLPMTYSILSTNYSLVRLTSPYRR